MSNVDRALRETIFHRAFDISARVFAYFPGQSPYNFHALLMWIFDPIVNPTREADSLNGLVTLRTAMKAFQDPYVRDYGLEESRAHIRAEAKMLQIWDEASAPFADMLPSNMDDPYVFPWQYLYLTMYRVLILSHLSNVL